MKNQSILYLSLSSSLRRLLRSSQESGAVNSGSDQSFKVNYSEVLRWHKCELVDKYDGLVNELFGIQEQLKIHKGMASFQIYDDEVFCDRDCALTLFTLIYNAYKAVKNDRPYHAVIAPVDTQGFGVEVMAKSLEEAHFKLECVYGNVIMSIWNDEDAHRLR